MNGDINRNDCAAMQMSLTLSYEWRICKTAILSGFNFRGNKWWGSFQHLLKLCHSRVHPYHPRLIPLSSNPHPITPYPISPMTSPPQHQTLLFTLHTGNDGDHSKCYLSRIMLNSNIKPRRRRQPRQSTIIIQQQRTMTDNNDNHLNFNLLMKHPTRKEGHLKLWTL